MTLQVTESLPAAPGEPIHRAIVPALTCSIHARFDALRATPREWDQLVLQTGAHLYATEAWSRTWWKFYGDRRELVIFEFHHGGELAGIVPMFIDRIFCGPGRIRIAKLVGCDSALTLASLAVMPEQLRPVLAMAIDHLIAQKRCDAIWFGPLDGVQPVVSDALRELCNEKPDMVRLARDNVVAPHTSFSLSTNFEGYVSSLPKRQRQNHRRDVNLMNRSFRVKADLVSDVQAVEREFDTFAKMHAQQWQAMGKSGHFGDWPRSVEFNRELIRSLDGSNGLAKAQLFRMSADDQIISYQYGFRFGDCLYWRLPARRGEAEWDRFGLGRLGLMTMLEQAIGEGIRTVEAGMGHYDYKVQLGGREHPAQSMLLVANRRLSRLRVRAFAALADVLHLSYYKVWFLRLAPRLNWRRPLWKTWIRTRL